MDSSFGEPLLITAAGSVIAGFGNANSDLDLYAIVPDEVASTLPLMSYPEGSRIDVVLHGAGQVTKRYEELTTTHWPPAEIGPGDLGTRRQVLDSVSRFGLGLLLTGTPEWSSWQRRLDAELSGWISSWYAAEAVRKRIAARVFAERKPMVAALRIGEALAAALERRAVERGERYFKPKWLGEKLRKLDDRDGLAAFELAMCPPASPDKVPAYLAQVGELLDHYARDVDGSAWRVRLSHARGTEQYEFGESRLVTRWGLRTLSVPAGGPVDHAKTWTFALDEEWHPDVAALFVEDLLWLGVECPV
ncbi:hypothetical protein [Streptomyces sp. CB01881]|uniref:hypothetical protein n=1 Tax=Streptomyces sp. CB01881 TaxID=2078691 RepID=UPI0019D6204A|nr:hypothetical protein [Streptomyces sp. CB01881]